MSSITAGGRRSRRRLALWLAFGAVGLSMGAVWATGLATFSSGAGTAGVDPIVTPGSPASATNYLTSAVTPDTTNWTVTWNGLWGLSPEYSFFTVTTPSLSATPGPPTPTSATYNIAMLLSNGASLTAAASWQTLQLKVWLVNAGASGTCTAGSFPGLETDGSGAAIPVAGGVARVFNFDSYDSAVYWNAGDTDVLAGLANQGTPTKGIIAGQTYCVGVQETNPANFITDGAENTNGTVLRASDIVDSPPVVDYPQFIATLNRAS
jgi:hypothetical protein